MPVLEITTWQLLVLFQHELLLFAGIFFLLGALDDISVDLCWLWLRLTGRGHSDIVETEHLATANLNGMAAVFIPAWNEAAVIGDTVAHMLKAWPQDSLRLYVGCYRNDAATVQAVIEVARSDPRIRLVIHDREGPTTKADCLNRLYKALRDDELRAGFTARMVVFHDAEDMVDPAALKILEQALDEADFVQLPVLPLPQENSRWIGSHYCEEFAEAHGKGLVVRDALGAAIPAAGVGCAVARDTLANLASARGGEAPFEPESLTEDYELGLAIADSGGRCRFVRKRHQSGELVATRAYFPNRLDHVVTQKTRWIHGIAFQGWDRLGWISKGQESNFAEVWMRVRDRRGPLTAFVLFIAYALLALSAFAWGATLLGYGEPIQLSQPVRLLLTATFVAFIWRTGMRFIFTAREYGFAEGARAVLRIPITNIIAIMAGRRALVAYIKTLIGAQITWDKTPHFDHPSRLLTDKAAQGAA